MEYGIVLKNRSVTRLSVAVLLLALSFLPGASSYAQATSFDNWYGFNTQIGTQPYLITSSTLADIDNDGDLDVVASKAALNDGDPLNGLVVLKNSGSGMFNSTPVHYSSSLNVGYVTVADLNNDGFKDVIYSNLGAFTQGTSISVRLNLGDGTFGNPTSYTVGAGPQGIVAADFNGDGNIDLAVANWGFFGTGTTISVLLNAGGGVFGTAVPYPAGDAPFRIGAARLDTNNTIDLVVASTSTGDARINVLLNPGNGVFNSRTQYTGVGRGVFSASVAIADVNNDGRNDILSPSFDEIDGAQVNVYRNQGNGTFLPVTVQMDPFSSPSDIKCADLNNDGWMDFVMSSATARAGDGFEVALNNGGGGFSFSYKSPAGQNTVAVMLGDVTKDNLVDILTADSYSMQITVHKNQGQGIFPFPLLSDLVGSQIAGSIDAADINGNSRKDIVISASGRAAVDVPVKIAMNAGGGTFPTVFTHSIRGGGVQAKFRDLNGDNIPDLLFASGIQSPPYDLHYAINNGNGTFGPVQTKSLGACGWYDVDAFDLNNDGLNDAVLTEWLGCVNVPESSRRIYICLNNGNGTFADPIIKVVGPNPGPLGVGDFNHDGNLDIVTGVSGANIEVNLGLGNGNLQPPVQYSIGSQGGATDIAVADLNNDGNLDIASCNFWEGTTMSILFGNGNGTFQPAVILPSAYSPDLLNVSGIVVGDMDNDGDKDILVANNASNSFSLYTNNNGVFSFSMRVGGYWGASAPFFADFDNDGKGDIVALGGLQYPGPPGVTSTLLFIKGLNTGPTHVSQDPDEIPNKYSLEQNYPNPFNPSTTIQFTLPEQTSVKLEVFNTLGQRVALLLDDVRDAGHYTEKIDASQLASGVYYYRLSAVGETSSRRDGRAGGFVATKKMLLLK
jgi:hypothetical protein